MSQDQHQIIKRPAARWYGGKWVLGKWIISHFPSHRIYVEPFSGMWSVGLQKQPSEIEVYNDLHDDAVNFWTELRDNPQELIPLIESTYFDKELYDRACQPGGSTLELAVKFYAQCLLSYTGGGVIAPGTSTARLQKPEVQKHDHLWPIAHRIKNLQIFNKDAFDIIKEFDSPDTLFYCDPCYLPETRTSPGRYVHDLTIEQHRQLASLLNEVSGQVVLSGYPSEIYDSLYSSWQKSTKKTATNTTHKQTEECLWIKGDQSVESAIALCQTVQKNNLSITTGTEEVKNPLQQSQLHKKGLCDYVINVASGCLHGCTFCYVPSTPAIRARQEHLQDKGVENPQYDWGKYLFVREAIAQQLEEVLANKRTWQETPSGKGVVMLCSGTDPYQNNKTAAITRACVEVLLKYGKRVRILTRSPLWTKDLDILVNPLVTVGMSLPHLDDRLSRQIEPNAPLPSSRYRALQKGATAGCRLFVAMAPTPPSMGLPEFQEHLSKLMAIKPEVIFWEPINARGTNGTRMLEAGIEFAKDISNTQTWADNFIKQWQELETAASSAGCQELLHIWPDKALKGYISEDQLEHWWSRPTVEKWPPNHESPQEAPTNNIADNQYSFGKLDISFGHTCDRLLSGSKTVTRREWKPRHVAKFIKAYENNQLVRALSKDRRYKGEQIGWLKLTSPPRSEALSQITQEDCAAEGYPELTPLEFHQRFFQGLTKDTEVWVIEFQFIPSDEIPELTVASCQPTDNQEALLPATLATPETRTKDDYSLTPDRIPDRIPDRTPDRTVEKSHLTTCSSTPLTAQQLTLPILEMEEEFSQVSSWTKDCWRTPNNKEQPILDLVAKALGGVIGLDPTADDRHNVPAQRYFTKANNCLIQDDWSSPAGTAFMNPPFSNPLPFLEKLVSAIQRGQVKEAIVLLPVNCINNIGTGKLIQLHGRAYCHWRGRIAFIDEFGKPQKKSDFDCTLIYFGDRPIRFTNCFYNYGTSSLIVKEVMVNQPDSSENQAATAINPGWLTANNIKDLKEQFDQLYNKTVKAAFADKWLGICAENLTTTLELCNSLLSTMQSEELYKVSSSIEGNVAYKNFDDYYSQRFNQSLQQLLRLAPFGITTGLGSRHPMSSEFGVRSSEFGTQLRTQKSDHQLPKSDTNNLQLSEPDTSSRQLSEPDTSDSQLPPNQTSSRQRREPTNEFGVLRSPFSVKSDHRLPESYTSNCQLSESGTSSRQLPPSHTDVRQLPEPDTSDHRLLEPTTSDDQLPESHTSSRDCADSKASYSPIQTQKTLARSSRKKKVLHQKTPNSELRTPNSKKRPPKNEGSGYIEKILCNVQRNLARGKDPDYYWQYHYFYTDEDGVAKHRSTHVSKSLYSTVSDLISSGRSHEEILKTLNKKKRIKSSFHQKNLNKKKAPAS